MSTRPSPSERLIAKLKALGWRVNEFDCVRGYWASQDVVRWTAQAIPPGVDGASLRVTLQSWDTITRLANARALTFTEPKLSMSGTWEVHAAER